MDAREVGAIPEPASREQGGPQYRIVVADDIGMPRRNGYEAALLIRREPWGSDVILIATTGWGQEQDQAQAYASGFDLHLTKPISPAMLPKAFKELRARRTAGAE